MVEVAWESGRREVWWTEVSFFSYSRHQHHHHCHHCNLDHHHNVKIIMTRRERRLGGFFSSSLEMGKRLFRMICWDKENKYQTNLLWHSATMSDGNWWSWLQKFLIGQIATHNSSNGRQTISSCNTKKYNKVDQKNSCKFICKWV